MGMDEMKSVAAEAMREADFYTKRPDHYYELLAAAALTAVGYGPCLVVSPEGFVCDRTGPHDTHEHRMGCGATATWSGCAVAGQPTEQPER